MHVKLSYYDINNKKKKKLAKNLLKKSKIYYSEKGLEIKARNKLFSKIILKKAMLRIILFQIILNLGCWGIRQFENDTSILRISILIIGNIVFNIYNYKYINNYWDSIKVMDKLTE
jgi:hypothetical protein